jgi:hypothetical protein
LTPYSVPLHEFVQGHFDAKCVAARFFKKVAILNALQYGGIARDASDAVWTSSWFEKHIGVVVIRIVSIAESVRYNGRNGMLSKKGGKNICQKQTKWETNE